MRLKHLQLQGYKTFAAKTEFRFPSGITAIIGPNGSGKSNITDAVRWVLGEQSFSTLRGKRTEDMIFSGSQSRPRAGMAEVILTLDNSERWLPLEFSEITISRRAFRDSQNEYRINGSRVRLRDVSELLSQSGLSRRTYTVIGQGVVDSVLSLRAQERRELFEEAAGIAHYREKRDNALHKLEQTSHNLERVHDIITEIEPRLQRLERQAERAREHDELSLHLEESLRLWYGYQWRQANTDLERASQTASQREEQHNRLVQRLQQVSEGIDRVRREQSDTRRKLGDHHRQSSILHARAEEAQRELAVLAERKRQLSVQRDEHLTEMTALEARIATQNERVAQSRSELVAAEKALAHSENEDAKAQSAFDTLTAHREALLTLRNAASDEAVEIRTELAERNSRYDALAEHAEVLVAQTQDIQAELAQQTTELDTQLAQAARVKGHLGQVEIEQQQTNQAISDLNSRKQTAIEQMEREQTILGRARETEAEITARFELLGELRRDLSSYGQAARALLISDGSGAIPGIIGVLAQMVHVPPDSPPGITAAVEAALGAYAGAVIVADWQTATQALAFLRNEGIAGRVVLLAMEHPGAVQTAPVKVDPKADAPTLSTQVRCNDALRPLVNRLLSQAYLFPDLDTALLSFSNLPAGSLCVTLEGEVLRTTGAIEGGRTTEKVSPLAQEQEWMQLNTRRAEIGARREAIEAKVARSSAALEKIEEQQTHYSAILDDIRARWTAANTVRDKLTRQAELLQQELEWRRSQIASNESAQQKIRLQLQELAQETAQLTQALAVADARLQELTAELEALATTAASDELTAALMALAAARQTLEGRQNVFHELETNLSQIEEARESHRRRVAELADEEQSESENSAQLMQTQADLNSQLETLSAEIEPAEARLAALDVKQARLEARERLERTRLREFEGHLSAARLEVQRREDALLQLRRRIEEDLGLVELELGPATPGQTPLPLHPLVSKLPLIRKLPEGVEDEIKRLRAQLRRVGPINPNAREDYKEVSQRYDFLQEQSSDLVDASDSLRKIIAEMDGLIEHAFGQTFNAVAAEFSRAFTTLFGGGHARLELSDPDDLSNTGVEVVAQPPGKRLQALASLSGGERALTAVALIFSILRVSPTPFCILDEVDAMLDEANIGRFRTMLEALAEFTQIVIVTHNRGTITAAETVYGVSMGADSVSQVYSIRMDGEESRED